MKAQKRLINKKAIDVISFVDLQQIAMTQNHYFTESKNTFNQQKVYKIDRTEGLYTFEELKQRFLH
jgi:hypothetical protein